MIVKKLSHICLSTLDLDKVYKFYINELNFKISHKFINSKNELYGYFINAGNNTFLEFFLSKKINRAKNNIFRHLCFEVYDLKKVYNKFKKKNPNLKIKIGKTDRVKQFFVKDFEGNIIEFHERSK